MLKKFAIGALSCALFAQFSSAAIVTFAGKDDGVGPGGARPNADAAQAAFLAAIGAGTTYDFEAQPTGDFANLDLGGGTNLSLTGAVFAICNGICASGQVDLGYNTTAGGANHLRIEPDFGSAGATATFTFAPGVDAFGAYFTGTESTFPGIVSILFDNGVAQQFFLDENLTGGGVLFFGFTDFGNSITSISIFGGATDGSRDIFGVDDVTIHAASEVPEPGTFALLGAGLLGILASRRKFGRG